jgi:hypothetical protein
MTKAKTNHSRRGKTRNGVTKSGKPDMRLKANRQKLLKPGNKPPKGRALKKVLKRPKSSYNVQSNPNIPHQGTAPVEVPTLVRDSLRWKQGTDLKQPMLDGRYRRAHEAYMRAMGIPARTAKAFVKAGHIPDEYFHAETYEGTETVEAPPPETVASFLSRSHDSAGNTIDGLKDSGTRRDFHGGAVRDGQLNKGRPSLVPYFAESRVNQWYEKGARKYAERNWEKGIPLSVYYDSARHHMDKWKAGFMDEDHLAAALWNLQCIVETEERIKRGILPPTLDDMPHTYEAFDDPDVFDVPKTSPGQLKQEYSMGKDGKMRQGLPEKLAGFDMGCRSV